MTRPRRAAPRWRQQDRADALVLVAGVGAGVLMMLVGWAPTVDVPAPLPISSTAGPASTSASRPGAPAQARDGSPHNSPGERPTDTALDQTVPADTRTEAEVEHQPEGVIAGPHELVIPSLGIRASFEEVTVTDGALVIPDDPARLGRWTGGADLHDATGAVLLSGHVAWGGKRGALWGLAAAEPGADVLVSDEEGHPTRWQITRVWAVERGSNLPELFRTTGAKRLAVVTCGGRVIGGHYSHNVILEAAPAPAT